MTSIMTRLRRRLQAVRAESDRGTTLMELLVGMVIMSIFMAIFTGAIVMMTSNANKVEAASNSANQTSQAMIALDKSVRYADVISTPGLSTGRGDWYVEYDTTLNGNSTCTQLRIDSRQLQRRTWSVSGGTAGAISSWVPVAGNIMNGSVPTTSADVPFVLPAASGAVTSRFQQLKVTLIATSGNTATSTNRAQMTFTALNSVLTAAGTSSVCQQAGRP